jgi:GntR family transcriptional regulator
VAGSVAGSAAGIVAGSVAGVGAKFANRMPPAMAADSTGPLHGPLYGRIATLMRQRIGDGIWPVAGQIPTIDRLMEEFAASRVTVRQALGLLERDGLIHRQRGRGTFVADHAGGFERIRLGQSWRSLIETIDGTTPRLLRAADNAIPPNAREIAGNLAPAYRYMCRVHARDGTPFAVMHLYLDRRCYDRAPDRFDNELVIPLLRELPDVTLRHAQQALAIGCAETEEARQLKIPLGAPVGKLRRVILDDSDCAVYIGDLVYRGDLIRMEMDFDISAEADQ